MYDYNARLDNLSRQFVLTLLLIIVPTFSSRVSTMAEEQVVDKFFDGNVNFAARLYQHLTISEENKNIFISPFSISTALCMTVAGARGETEKQMLEVLGLEGILQEDVHLKFKKILASIKNSEIASIANKVFVQKNYPILTTFEKILEDSYCSTCSAVDFSESKAVEIINEWVQKETNNKIPKLVGELDGATRMIIANAIYFKSLWASQFPARNSEIAPFHISANEVVNVNMMYQSGKFSNMFHESSDCMVLELPHKNMKTSFLVFLPSEINGLSKVEAEFGDVFLNEVTSSMSKSKVKIWMPSFKLEQSYSLKSALSELGMTDLFSVAKADLGGISLNNDLSASDVIHKGFIEVNEEGTEAAAASGVILMKRCIQREESFKADHPFMFCILEKETNTVLFMGRLKNPESVRALHQEL